MGSMEFEKRKAAALAAMASTDIDKSPKGTIDTPIIPLLNAINSSPSFFTTSSCSGRISVLSQPKTPTSTSKKAKGGSWLFISHDPADPNSVLSLLFPAESTHPSELVFRFEPLIIAVECRDVGSAQTLVSLAISCGFRESGITSAHRRVIVAIRCSIRLEVPLGDTDKVMVSEEYVRYLVKIANGKMEANRLRTERFLAALQCSGSIKGRVLDPDVGGDLNALVGDKNGSVCNEEQHPCVSSSEDQIILSQKVEDATPGSSKYLGCSSSIVQLVIAGESLENLFLWGHTSCNLDNTVGEKVLVFGGFGGVGRHARRNESLELDVLSGTIKRINISCAPSSRMGHTSSIVGHLMFVIGGRADPTNILNDVWILNTTQMEWKLLECSGCYFPPRHRHAAAVINSKIYVFGGLDNDLISSSLHVLDTMTLQWSEIDIQGEWPSARHSHSLVAYGSQLYMFGGYNGKKPLGDLYSFDIQTCSWRKEKMAGKAPCERFSHSMFVYKQYLGILGGCPVRQTCQELVLLDMQQSLWKHVMLPTVGNYLFVRSTANVIGDDLVMIGGGASCYAFGTMFSRPHKLNLLSLVESIDTIMPCESGAVNVVQNEKATEPMVSYVKGPGEAVPKNLCEGSGLTMKSELPGVTAGDLVPSLWLLQVQRTYAKLTKDLLKKFKWLDLARKVILEVDGKHICFPVTDKFCAISLENQHILGNPSDGQNADFRKRQDFSLSGVSSLEALSILNACGASRIPDTVVKVRRTPKSPFCLMHEAVASLLKSIGLPEHLLCQLPSRWEKLGNITVLPRASFEDPLWRSIGMELWIIVAKSINACRLARQGLVAANGTRDSRLEILLGDDGWVDHRENGIFYSFDATKCMFSWGNLSEKLRMAHLECRDEIIVDLFAGIGYFTLPFLVSAKAKLVYACEWNPHAIEALKHNVQANSVVDRCVILEGDNRLTAPKGVADRVCLGLLPTSEGSWLTAIKSLRAEGGILHVHGNVKDTEETSWTKHVTKSLHEMATSEGHRWEVSIEHVEKVKWYAPHIRHLVADVRCREVHE